ARGPGARGARVRKEWAGAVAADAWLAGASRLATGGIAGNAACAGGSSENGDSTLIWSVRSGLTNMPPSATIAATPATITVRWTVTRKPCETLRPDAISGSDGSAFSDVGPASAATTLFC